MPTDDQPNDQNELKKTLGGIAKLYGGNLDVHGLTAKSVGWKDQASQWLRFEKLVQVIDQEARRFAIVVNDLGCGYGAMFQYLEQIPSLKIKGYYGYDISEEMLVAARKSVSDLRAEFICSPRVTRVADYSFVSGTFNVKLQATDKLWTEYIKETLLNLATLSNKGFAFNALSVYVDWKEDNLYYADPFMFFDFCKRNISRYVSLLHDYPLFEWTINVRKEGSPG